MAQMVHTPISRQPILHIPHSTSQVLTFKTVQHKELVNEAKQSRTVETHNVVKMGMSDEEEILMNSSGGTSSDIESTLKLRDDNASLMTPN